MVPGNDSWRNNGRQAEVTGCHDITTVPVVQPLHPDVINRIICGDCREILPKLPDNSIDLVITSPPYFQQREYGSGGLGEEPDPETYIVNLVGILRECFRVVKPTGSVVINLGDKYLNGSLSLLPYRVALEILRTCQVILVNQITWVKTNPPPRQFRRRLVTATEPFFHFAKTQQYQYFPEQLAAEADETGRRHGRGEAESARRQSRRKERGQSYRQLIARSVLTPEQKIRAWEALEKVQQEVTEGRIHDFRLKIKGVHAEPFGGQNGGRKGQLEREGFTVIRMHGEKLKSDVMMSAVECRRDCPHPAVYPVRVISQLIALLTQPGDTVLDPFVGSGTTAVTAWQQGRRYIGIDIHPEYCDYARQWLAHLSGRNDTFSAREEQENRDEKRERPRQLTAF